MRHIRKVLQSEGIVKWAYWFAKHCLNNFSVYLSKITDMIATVTIAFTLVRQLKILASFERSLIHYARSSLRKRAI